MEKGVEAIKHNSLIDKWNREIAILLSVIFLVGLFALPFSDSEAGQNRTTKRTGIYPIKKDLPIGSISKTYVIAEVNDYELWNGSELNMIALQSMLDCQTLIMRFLKYLLPFIGVGLISYYLGYVNKKNNKAKALRAMAIGGHDPPFIKES